MDLTLSLSDKKFIAESRQFLAAHWSTSDALLAGQRGALARARYLSALADSARLVGHWPARYGGLDWVPRERWLWETEAAATQAPQPPTQGPDLLGAVLLAHGTEQQRAEHLPGIAANRVTWCQALAEDSAGLDVPRIETSATPVIDSGGSPNGWILDGHKPWVLDMPAGDPLPQNTHFAYVLARLSGFEPVTRPDSVAGLAEPVFGLFLLDLATAGVTVAQRRMVGEPAEPPVDGCYRVGSLTFDAVQLPVAALLGEPDAQATLALAIERSEFGLPASVARNAVLLAQLRDFVAGGELDGGSLWRDEDYRARLHELEVANASLQALQARAVLDNPGVDEGATDFAAAANLLVASRSRQLSQQLADLQVEALGYFALPYASVDALDNEGPIGPEFSQPVLFGMLSNRAREAVLAPRDHLKNIIAKSVLGLSSAT